MKILMILTSHDQLGETDQKTGLWLEEFSSPYYEFIDHGFEVTLASPKGGQPPIDPKSTTPDGETQYTKRFDNDSQAKAIFAQTKKLSDIDIQKFDAAFYPGGHGPLWDLAEDKHSIRLIENFYNARKPVAAVCHAPAVLRHVLVDGRPIVEGKKVTGFSNSEEEGVELTNIVPFLLEDELKKLGGLYKKSDDWKSFVVTDGLLITGQNPASSKEAAEKLIELLEEREIHLSENLHSFNRETRV